ncbi:MAG: sugar phosphate isomerase/epimerase [Proteobacteria bacterium]|nr:sugar phosphate isomerase/epimerase [Pseudomonadota bacterium]
MYPDLTCHPKGRYPFRLGCPSFIYPEDIVPNVEKLGPFMDEIELLILESMPAERLPSTDQIKTLLSLKEEFNITYNVHLPTDISLSGFSDVPRKLAVDIMKKVFERMHPLSPETFTLHLPFGREKNREIQRPVWEENSLKSLEELVATGVDPQTISIETLLFPFEWLKPVVDTIHTSVCMDVGHLILTNQDLRKMILLYGEKITMMHLHGVDRTGEIPKDHQALSYLTEGETDTIGAMLKTYQGGISLEVFSYQNLQSSLEFFLTLMK